MTINHQSFRVEDWGMKTVLSELWGAPSAAGSLTALLFPSTEFRGPFGIESDYLLAEDLPSIAFSIAFLHWASTDFLPRAA